MSKAAVVYYSGSGNTEAMADVIVNALGADKIEAEAFGAAKAADYDAIAFGCPAMGAEELEDGEFQPMFDAVKGALGGKKVALFGSYDWGVGEWLTNWEARCAEKGINLAAESVKCNNAPDSDGLAACRALGAAIA